MRGGDRRHSHISGGIFITLSDSRKNISRLPTLQKKLCAPLKCSLFLSLSRVGKTMAYPSRYLPTPPLEGLMTAYNMIQFHSFKTLKPNIPLLRMFCEQFCFGIQPRPSGVTWSFTGKCDIIHSFRQVGVLLVFPRLICRLVHV